MPANHCQYIQYFLITTALIKFAERQAKDFARSKMAGTPADLAVLGFLPLSL